MEELVLTSEQPKFTKKSPHSVPDNLPDLDSFKQVCVSVSGGKDSQACANLAIARWGKDKVVLVHARVELEDTPEDELIWESKENLEHLAYLEEIWQMPIHRVDVLNTDGSGLKKDSIYFLPENELRQYSGLTNIIINRGYMPGSGYPFCTMSKVTALEKFLNINCPNALRIIGQRAEESTKRAALPEYGFDSKYNRYIYRPVHKWPEQRVIDYLTVELGQKLNPIYSLPPELRSGRGGNCEFCINQKNYELRKSVRRSPRKALLFVEKIENVVGPRRDYSVKQAIEDAAMEQSFPGIFEEDEAVERELPKRVCGVGDNLEGCGE